LEYTIKRSSASLPEFRASKLTAGRYGLIADLIECIIQRSLGFNTMDVRVAYDYVKACLLDPTVTKTVLIAHSQGGIIASMVMDGLFADLPAGVMSKLVSKAEAVQMRDICKLADLFSTDKGSLHLWKCSLPFQQSPCNRQNTRI